MTTEPRRSRKAVLSRIAAIALLALALAVIWAAATQPAGADSRAGVNLTVVARR
ncbi:hypothetical protein [Mangrovactinospora gilvigrisea]|uniref:hypothetical protein n=1 Tax=Mangrovactinospora gilvigrisea TaxID=1428644 RepID=UPI00158777A8|nr:hypothetical protein [Mangrovactinospora gilvigrisea]